jgi:heat shock protein HslJ
MKNLLFAALILGCFSCSSSKNAAAPPVSDAPIGTPTESNKPPVNTPDPEPDNRLQDTRWVLKSMGGTDIPKMPREMYLMFKANAAVEGFGGCNGFGGSFEATSKTIKMSKIISTKMWCDNGKYETAFMKALELANGYQIAGDELKLSRDGELLAVFTAVYLKEKK